MPLGRALVTMSLSLAAAGCLAPSGGPVSVPQAHTFHVLQRVAPSPEESPDTSLEQSVEESAAESPTPYPEGPMGVTLQELAGARDLPPRSHTLGQDILRSTCLDRLYKPCLKSGAKTEDCIERRAACLRQVRAALRLQRYAI